MKRGHHFKILWTARILIGLVLFFNLECALVFLFWPAVYTSGFELVGTGGEAALQGMGILFIMWNIPYLLALLNPQRFQTSLFEAVLMQAVGVGGETLLVCSLPPGHLVLASSIQRFILFDAGGLLCLLVALGLVRWLARMQAKKG